MSKNSNRGEVIRIVDAFLRKLGLSEPRGSGAAQIAAAEAYHSLRANSICQGLQIPLEEFRAIPARFAKQRRCALTREDGDGHHGAEPEPVTHGADEDRTTTLTVRLPHYNGSGTPS